jgi:SAM-dependent methyltransferase
MTTDTPAVQDHFTARASKYDASSRWCTDNDLLERMFALSGASAGDRVLDVACGTGLVSAAFHGRVGHLVGVDLTPAMFEQARPHVDELVPGSGEALPFPDDSFQAVVCRQGIQFMDAPVAVAEMVRVCKPGGRIVLADLCAYGPEDRDEYFEVLRLRNPARRNFFVEGDVAALLFEAGCESVNIHQYVSTEDVDAWSDNEAISEARREGIRDVYRNASPAFRRLHAVSSPDERRFFDHMLFGLSVGQV